MVFSRRRVIGLLLLAALLIALEFFPPFRTSLGSVIARGNKIEGGLHQQSRSFRQWLASTLDPDQSRELARLEEQVGVVAVDYIRLKELAAENVALRDLVAFQNRYAEPSVAARVIGRDPSDPAGLVRLSAGTASGVAVGAAVVNAEGFFLAEVVAASETTSVARLLQSRTLNISARVIGREGMVGLLESPDGLSLRLTQLPKEGVIEVGDAVVTGAESATLPSNLPIGVVVDVSGSAQDLWRVATVSALASAETADFVSVVLSTNDSP